MNLRPLRAWSRAILLVPALFALAIAAVSLAASVIPARQPAGDRSHPPGTGPDSGPSPPAASSRLVLPVTLPSAVGGVAVITVRITTDPPAPEVLDASREYLITLLRSLVHTLPASWSPDEAGVTALKHAIEEAVPVAIAGKLPEGTRVTASADVTVTRDATGVPASPQSPAAPQTQTTPPSP